MSETNTKKTLLLGENLIDLAGLTKFWELAKMYVSEKYATADRVNSLETIVGNYTDGETAATGICERIEGVEADIRALVGGGEGGVEGGISGMINSAIEKLGSASVAEDYDFLTGVSVDGDGKLTVTSGKLPELNFDEAGAAADALTAAKAYTNEVVGKYAEGETSATGLRAEIADVKSESVVTMTASGDNTSDVKKYIFKQGDVKVGTINIPKDLVVVSGEVVICAKEGENFGKKCIELTFTSGEPVHIPVDELVDVYTAGNSYITISDDNKISVNKDQIISGLAVANDVYTKAVADDKFATIDTVNTLSTLVGAPATTDVAATGLFLTIEENELTTTTALNDLNTRLNDLGGIVKGVYENEELKLAGHAQRLDALEKITIATDDQISALFVEK